MSTLNFPILERLDIWDYGLFPGTAEQEPGLHINFPTGLTLVVGANGLGKTTLVTALFRMLTGPFDISGLSAGGDLGNIRLEPSPLNKRDRSIFANRVVDGARLSVARLAFSLGNQSVVIQRRLHNLALTEFKVDGKALPTDETESFQIKIPQLVGLATFADWILLLRHLVFYFEERRALVWDPSAQRQVLRFLFLPPDVAKKWSDDERGVLTLDSAMRNINAVVNREERALAESQKKAESAPGVLEELRLLEGLQEVALLQQDQLESNLLALDTERQQARLRVLTFEQEHEARYREFERAKLIALENLFPALPETSRFILAQLLTEGECIACGNVVPEVAAEYNRLLERNRCVICESDLSGEVARTKAPKLAEKRLQRAAKILNDIKSEVDEARLTLEEAEQAYKDVYAKASQVSLEIAERSENIDNLIRKLPPEESSLHQRHSEISLMRGRASSIRAQLTAKRAEFRTFISEVGRQLVSRSEEVKRAFNQAAEGFLLENCELVLALHRQRIGETGAQIEFPAFELDMTGSNFTSPVRRTGPEQVSESQREFIDLAFRMALVQVSSRQGNGSLVIDAPESSLDAVFVIRAAHVLSQFASRPEGNRLLITSNLVESSLIPDLIRKTVDAGGGFVFVDLLSIAVPTAAVRELGAEYERVRDNLLHEAHSSD